ncbi:hypothetical protein [Methylobacterium sp. Leaf108]|uniref:hypothetical protein n=1 Tax=Methylobacterium sp. Leaf108 TaxID=1736256 RepID=UPI000A45BE65|nr:hypothetical protein [Methylobacterium sp. Leaf108]
MRSILIMTASLLLATAVLAGGEEDAATRLMATMAWARNNCPRLVVHSEEVQAAMEAMNVDPWELTKNRQRVIQGQNIYNALRGLGAMVPEFCRSLDAAFGKNGTERRGLVSLR